MIRGSVSRIAHKGLNIPCKRYFNMLWMTSTLEKNSKVFKSVYFTLFKSKVYKNIFVNNHNKVKSKSHLDTKG